MALDSLNDDANYIHIDDIKENVEYYCPCCKGKIKPRAYKNDREYQVQPHFYHETDGCNEETFVHYICKNWLFENGCKFIVAGIEYEVIDVEIEQTLYTKFGDYRPDIIVTTTSGKIFYFEIVYSNKKTLDYIPKWDELGNDVVEVDTRYFINQRFEKNIPEFNLIYSNGECFIKTYIKPDYDSFIGERKRYWKRQDKINYKIQWERLDWFWNDLIEYKKDKNKRNKVIETFSAMDIQDQIWCCENLSKKSCIDFRDDFRNITNQNIIEYITDIANKNGLKFEYTQISKLKYEYTFVYFFRKYFDYDLHLSKTGIWRISKGLLLDAYKHTDTIIDCLLDKIKYYNECIENISKLSNLFYINYIRPQSHISAKKESIENLKFDIRFNYGIQDENEHLRKLICDITEIFLLSKFNYYKHIALEKKKEKIFICSLKNNDLLNKMIYKLEYYCKSKDGYDFKVKVNYEQKTVTILNSYDYIASYIFSSEDNLDKSIEEAYKLLVDKINRYKSVHDIHNKYISLVNNCKNHRWEIYKSCYGTYSLIFKDVNERYSKKLEMNKIKFDKSYDEKIKKLIYSEMKALIDLLEKEGTLRIMEEK